jgi:hypothetical protein
MNIKVEVEVLMKTNGEVADATPAYVAFILG